MKKIAEKNDSSYESLKTVRPAAKINIYDTARFIFKNKLWVTRSVQAEPM